MDQERKNDWRELCKAVASELDPKKLMNLIAELTKALDNRDKDRKILIKHEDDKPRHSLRIEPAV